MLMIILYFEFPALISYCLGLEIINIRTQGYFLLRKLKVLVGHCVVLGFRHYFHVMGSEDEDANQNFVKSEHLHILKV